jgi:urease accessory protein
MTTFLPRLLQLSSPALPVGAFSYSQGLEWVAENGIVTDEASAERWIGSVLHATVASWDAPYVAAMMRSWQASDLSEIATLNDRFVASRETRELRSECVQMGQAMLETLRDWPGFPREWLDCLSVHSRSERLAFPTGWTSAAVYANVPVRDGVTAYLWCWLENAVMAAIKAVPLGQRAGQRILLALGDRISDLAVAAMSAPVEDCANFLPGFTLASMQHEHQYTRLFRS